MLVALTMGMFTACDDDDENTPQINNPEPKEQWGKTLRGDNQTLAREANAQLSKLKEEGDALVAAANKEQGRILREAMEERDKIVHEARKQAEIAAQKELDAVKQQIQIEKDEAIRDIRRQVAVLSVDIAEKVLRKSLEDKEAQMGMIDRMLDEVLTPNKN